MSLRNIFLSVPLLATAIAASSLQPTFADEPAPAPQHNAGNHNAPRTEGQPAEGGHREGAPREGAPREGGPREGGPREGGPRGPRGGGAGMGNETPEQRQERMTRMLQPYLDILPDLSDDQKTHIMAILDASSTEIRALRANQSIPQERKAELQKRLRGLLPQHIAIALTDAQATVYSAAVAEQAEAEAQMEKVGSVRADENVEQMRERLLQGYESVLEELSVKQKTALIKTLEASGEESAAINADTKLTAEQKLVALRKVHDAISVKVLPLLDAEQKVTWKKAHAAKRP